MKKVLVGGVMDILHYGHMNFLRRAREFGDHLTLAINTDGFVLRYKGKMPIMSTWERVEACRGIRWVDEVIVNESNENWLPTILRVKPQIIVTTNEWKKKNFYNQMQVSSGKLHELGISLEYVDQTLDISSTIIKQRILNASM